MTGTAPEPFLTDAPDAGAKHVVEQGLAAFNHEQAGYVDSRKAVVDC